MDRHGIEAEGLVREFKDVRAVDGIDLRVEPGEIYGFLGPNGAGKSTTVHMLTTLLPPTAGRARVGRLRRGQAGPGGRRAIGAALQEAALDPLLTGRDHMRLQTALHGVPRHERAAARHELLERVGLILAADRKVRTYSGGMKRRLDLALALVHGRGSSSSTSRRPASTRRAAARSGRRSDGSRSEEGVTVFLTTQYLEEADVLADRVGIIDHGRIVAEGTPAALKAEIGRPTVEVVPADPERATPRSPRSSAASASSSRSRPRASRSGCAHGELDLAEIVRALDAEGLHAANLQLHAPSLDDVFLEKTGRTLEGAAAEAEAGRAAGRDVSAVAAQVYHLARRSVVRQVAAAGERVAPVLFPLGLLAVNSGGLQPATLLPGFPTDRFVAFALAVPFLQGRCSRR